MFLFGFLLVCTILSEGNYERRHSARATTLNVMMDIATFNTDTLIVREYT